MSKLFSFLGGKKVVAYLLTMVLAGIKAKWPSVPLPNDEFLTDLVLAFFAAHTISDVGHMAASAWKEVLNGKAAPKEGTPVP